MNHTPSGPSMDACNFCGRRLMGCQCNKFEAHTEPVTIKLGSHKPPAPQLKSFSYHAAPITPVAEEDGRDSDAPTITSSILGLSDAQNANNSTAAGLSGGPP